MKTQTTPAQIDQEKADSEYFEKFGKPRLETPEETEARLKRNFEVHVKPCFDEMKKSKKS